MKIIDFNQNWKFKKNDAREWQNITLPHDAMIHEKREADSPGGSAHGYFPGGCYLYEKKFSVPADWENKTSYFRFGGVYKNAVVMINGKEAGIHPYGYVPFEICADNFLHYGEENTIHVTADNSQLPNSRWYTGSGIYRPVQLLLGSMNHIPWHGVRITTLSYAPARIRIKTEITGSGRIDVQILSGKKTVASGTGSCIELDIPDARLWSDETPELYTCRVTLSDEEGICDEVSVPFGIRLIEWSSKGFFINGRETLLRGGCIHHDNGILGAATYAESEERRIRIMKENGFNAVRSSHNPASDALIAACDKYGMYLIDETFDMWYMRKSKYDYAIDFDKWWEKDTAAMVHRDYNHPSVIMYSIANEVSEPYAEKGVNQTKAFVSLIHSMDSTRPVTGGINPMIISNAAKGNGIYKDKDTDDKSKKSKKQKKEINASLLFNMIASFTGPGMNNSANSNKVDRLISPCLDALDICGYNYASGRYPLEGEKHPDRIVFGSETFPQDICKNWMMVKKYPYLIGDFMWTSWDYLGESGLGAWSYNGGMPFNRPYPWLASGAGVIDLIGTPDASCKYAATVWELTDKPIIGVRPVNHPGVMVSKSVWRGTNAVESWAWKGCDNNKAIVEVYAQAAAVELQINGKSVGRKNLKDYKAVFKTRYFDGEVAAVAYDGNGQEIGRHSLSSASGDRRICATPEVSGIPSGGIAYVPISIQGENGVIESNDDRRLNIKVTGGTLLGFGSANPCTKEQYTSGSFTTYLGKALAVVRADAPGSIKLKISDGNSTATVCIEVWQREGDDSFM